MILLGEIRIVPDRGLSLSYAGPKAHVIIIDQKGDTHAILQGYSKSRAQDIAEHIEALLKAPP